MRSTSILKTAAYGAVRLSRLCALSRQLLRSAVVLCYHNIVARHDPSNFGAEESGAPSIHMDVDQFERQIRWLRAAVDVVSLDELTTRLLRRESVRGLVCLTFDDGYSGFFRWGLPALRSLGLPSTVFLVTGAHETQDAFWWDYPGLVRRGTPERRHHWLTIAKGDAATIRQLEEVVPPSGLHPDMLPASFATIRESLGPDLTIGAHTHSHRSLPTLADSELQSEFAHCAKRLEEYLGVTPRHLAYPYGSWDSRVRDAARNAGHRVCLTLDSGRVSAARSNLCALPRVNVPAGISDGAFEAWVSGLIPLHR